MLSTPALSPREREKLVRFKEILKIKNYLALTRTSYDKPSHKASISVCMPILDQPIAVIGSLCFSELLNITEQE